MMKLMYLEHIRPPDVKRVNLINISIIYYGNVVYVVNYIANVNRVGLNKRQPCTFKQMGAV